MSPQYINAMLQWESHFFFSYFDKYPNYVEAIIRFQCFFCRSHFFCLVCVRAPVNRLLSIIAYVRSYITLLLKRSEKRPCQFFHCEPSSFYLCCAANHTTTYFASFENINNCDADKKRKAALFISTYISFGLSFSFIRFSWIKKNFRSLLLFLCVSVSLICFPFSHAVDLILCSVW